MNIEKLSPKFKQLMQKSNVNSTLRLLANDMSNGILQISDETLQIPSLNLTTSRGTTSLPRSDIKRARKTNAQHCL